MRIEIKTTGLTELGQRLSVTPQVASKGIHDALWKSLFEIERKTKPLIPAKTGALRSSWGSPATGWKWVKGGWGSIGTNIEYAPFIEWGTGLFGPKKKAYSIAPRYKKALYWEGALHPVRGTIIHKGVKPIRFAERGTQASIPNIKKYFDGVAEKVVTFITKL